MTADPLQAPAHVSPALHQMENRLLHLSLQLDELHRQVAWLGLEMQTSADQVDVLTRHFTAAQPLHDLQDQIAALAAQMESNQGELAAITQQLAGLAPRALVEQLLEIAANQAQVSQLDEDFKRLSRTQFKANSLSESKEQQVQRALAALQEIATRRTQREEAASQHAAQEMDNVRRSARGEFAAEVLPALDSVELALEHGASLLQRLHARQDAFGAQQAQYIAEFADFLAAQEQMVERLQAEQQAPPGLWRRLLRGATESPTEAPPRPTPPTPLPATALQTDAQEMQSALEGWLQGLALVRQRFLALLSSEEIEEIDALLKPFDPRLHVALEAAPRADVEPNCVVGVLRKGYRQRSRVLRYAEVVVAQRPAPPTAPAITTDNSPANNLGQGQA